VQFPRFHIEGVQNAIMVFGSGDHGVGSPSVIYVCGKSREARIKKAAMNS